MQNLRKQKKRMANQNQEQEEVRSRSEEGGSFVCFCRDPRSDERRWRDESTHVAVAGRNTYTTATDIHGGERARSAAPACLLRGCGYRRTACEMPSFSIAPNFQSGNGFEKLSQSIAITTAPMGPISSPPRPLLSATPFPFCRPIQRATSARHKRYLF
jgi:hypothetical protein